MKFDSLVAFVQMDGQGLYVWAAYGITCLLLAMNLWIPAIRQLRFIRRHKRDAQSAQDRQE